MVLASKSNFWSRALLVTHNNRFASQDRGEGTLACDTKPEVRIIKMLYTVAVSLCACHNDVCVC